MPKSIDEILKILKDHKNETTNRGLVMANDVNILKGKVSQLEADINALRGAIQSTEYLIKKIENVPKEQKDSDNIGKEPDESTVVTIDELKNKIFKTIKDEENKESIEHTNGQNTEFSAEENLLNNDDSGSEN